MTQIEIAANVRVRSDRFRRRSTNLGKALSRPLSGFLILLACIIFVSACRTKVTAKPAVPPPVIIPMPNLLEVGENNMESGKYSEAVVAFESYLSQKPNAADRDTAIFKLGLCFALAGKNQQDYKKAQNQFRILVTQYPRSQYLPLASFILTLQASIDRLEIDLMEKDALIQEKEAAVAERDERIRKLADGGKSKDGRIKDRESRVRERDEKIKELNETVRRLTDELERMKKIDLERLPSRPPG
jgi:hypothetical protein